MGAREGLAWLLNYAVHAAVAALGAELLVRITRPSPADAHRLWRLALVAPLLTSSLFALFGSGGLAGTLVPASPLVLRVEDSAAAAASLASSTDGRATRVAAVAVALSVLAGAARFAIRIGRLRRRLAGDRTPADRRLRAALVRLSPRFALGEVQLTESAHLACPTALGARVIGFPAGAAALIGDAEVDAVLAHELAHLERGDPRWFFWAGLVQAALWIQPVNHLVVARLRRSAEIACDERAVAVTGDPQGLARALSWFAHAVLGPRAWRGAEASLPGAVPASNVVVERVRRLATSTPFSVSAPTIRSPLGAAAALLSLMAVAGSSVGVTFGPRYPSPARVANPPVIDALDLATASRRVVELESQEIRLQAEIGAAQPLASEPPTDGAAARLLTLEQDLRHVRAERAWLEQSLLRHPRTP